MKKTLVFILVLTFLLTGCNSGNNSSSSNINSQNIPTANNNISSALTSSELEDTTLPESTYCPNVSGHYHATSIEEFVTWAKKGVNTYGHDCTENFFNWRKNQSSIIIPKNNNTKYELQVITVRHESVKFSYIIKDTKTNHSHKRFNIVCYFLDETQSKLPIFELEKHFNIGDNIEIESDVCRWGEYRYVRSKNNGAPMIRFISSSMLYSIVATNYEDNNPPWKDEYFDYFDFETISLK